ncbi:MAG: hypothetical protein AB7F40_05385 [Victivallaceae bacterium]|nr:hypothetical protein [Victivallaceae bacterium]
MTTKILKVMMGVLCALVLAACSKEKPKEDPTTRMLAWVPADSEVIVCFDIIKTLDSGFFLALESKLPPEVEGVKLGELKPSLKDLMERGVGFGNQERGGLLFYSPACPDLKSLQPKLDAFRDKGKNHQKSEMGELGGRPAILLGGAAGAAVICLEENIFVISSCEVIKGFADIEKHSANKSALVKEVEPLLPNPICGVFVATKGMFWGVSVFKVSFEGEGGDEIDVMADVALKDAAAAKQIAGEIVLQSTVVFGMVAQQDKALLRKLVDGFHCEQHDAKVKLTAHYGSDVLKDVCKSAAPMMGQFGRMIPIK